MKEKYKIVTVSELASMLESKERGESIDFTFDDVLDEYEPSGWFRVKIVDLFNEQKGCVAMGYYGGGATIARCINPDEETLEELLKEMLWEISDTINPVERLCIDLTGSNGN